MFDEEPTPMNNPLRQVDPMKLIMTPHIIGNNPGSLGGLTVGCSEHSVYSTVTLLTP
jgi:phosphoglycerate dehydrogenase-like enzyme